MAGVARDLGANLRVVYADSQEGNNFDVIKEKSNFDFGPLEINAFK